MDGWKMKYITKTYEKLAKMRKQKQKPPISHKENVQKVYEDAQTSS